MDSKKFEALALQILLPTDVDNVLFLSSVDESLACINEFAKRRSMSAIALVRELSFCVERQIETTTEELIAREIIPKGIERLCAERNWSVKTALCELRGVAISIVRTKATQLETQLRLEERTGNNRTLAEICEEARATARAIESSGEGWPVGCLFSR